MMDLVNISLPAALLAGLAFGAGPCNITCLPYLGPVFMRGEGVKKSWRILLPFTLGRLIGYSSLGMLAGMAGQALGNLLQSSLAGWLLGVAAMLVGLKLMRSPSAAAACSRPHATHGTENTIAFVNRNTVGRDAVNNKPADMPVALFTMGAGMALNPCIPLTAILTAAAATGSAGLGLGLGLSFGLGAVLIPSLVFGLLMAHFGSELKQQLGRWSRQLEKISGGLLVMLGLATALGWVQP
jgi:cytochrome c biogenesis protein CcdA